MPENEVTVTENFATITGFEDVFGNELKIYPNPFTDVVRIVGAENCLLRVINVGGTVVHTQKIIATDETIKVENLPAGIYFFCIEKGGASKTVRIPKN